LRRRDWDRKTGRSGFSGKSFSKIRTRAITIAKRSDRSRSLAADDGLKRSKRGVRLRLAQAFEKAQNVEGINLDLVLGFSFPGTLKALPPVWKTLHRQIVVKIGDSRSFA
jgi:hypothetical protein